MARHETPHGAPHGWVPLLACQRPSGNSQLVEYPLDLAVLATLFSIVTQKNLIAENGRQQLGLVVLEAPVPNVFVKIKGRF